MRQRSSINDGEGRNDADPAGSEMGITRQRVSRLISGNMRYENFVRIINAAGYDVKIEKRKCEKNSK